MGGKIFVIFVVEHWSTNILSVKKAQSFKNRRFTSTHVQTQSYQLSDLFIRI